MKKKNILLFLLLIFVTKHVKGQDKTIDLASSNIKWTGKEIGFEKLVIKNNQLKCYFTSNKSSKYFESKNFKKILNFLTTNQQTCKLREIKDKLVLQHHNIVSINKALNFLNSIKNYNR